MMMLPITLLTSVHAGISMPSVGKHGISDTSLNILPYHAHAADEEEDDEEYDDEDDDDFDDEDEEEEDED